MKNLKLLFTALLLLLCATVATAHDFEVGGIYYNITDAANKKVEVTYRGNYADLYEYAGTIVIPESVTYNSSTYSVTSIGGSAFSDCYALTSIEIPNSVTSIGDYAFYYCFELTSVVIGNSVTSIGGYAFCNCDGLTSVVIGNSVTSIGDYAFEDCSRLANVVIGNSVTSIGNRAFSGCDGLTSIEIPNSVTSIGFAAFSGCYGLTSVVIGNSVTSIGESAFSGCSGLTSIEIPNSVTSIGGGAFYGCTGLTSVVIGNSVTSIGDRAFSGCTGLREVHISDLTAWCGIYFGNYDAQPLYYAKNLYLNGELLTELVVPNSVSAIKNYAFYNCSGLTSIEIPNSVTSIGGSAFSGCTGLTSVVIGNSVTSIGDYAFNGCTGLRTVVNFSNLTFSKGSSNNGYVAYHADKVINAPNGFIDGDFVWYENENGMTLAGYLGNAAELTLPTEYNGKNVTTIGNYAFRACTSLTGELVIHNCVTSIGTSAFEGCANIESLYISTSLESIGAKAFAGCEKIKEIKVGLEKPIRGVANIFADAVYDNAVLYVPTGTKSLYEKREPWNLFFDIVEMDFTGIEDMEAEGERVKDVYYDLSGRVVENPSSGIYIINGKKVVIK